MAEPQSSNQSELEEVTLTNVSRRPLLMRLPGKTLRLGPGEEQTVPKALLATTELLRMCDQHLVVVAPIAKPEGEAAPPAPEAEAASSEETAEASAAAEGRPPTEAEAAPSEGAPQVSIAAASRPATEAEAVSASESESAVVNPEVSPESTDAPQANPKDKRSTKPKPNPAKPEEN